MDSAPWLWVIGIRNPRYAVGGRASHIFDGVWREVCDRCHMNEEFFRSAGICGRQNSNQHSAFSNQHSAFSHNRLECLSDERFWERVLVGFSFTLSLQAEC
jgi:hypothetical protein